jgi:hypothetical protein
LEAYALDYRLGALEDIERSRGISSDANPRNFPPPIRAQYLLALETHGAVVRAANSVCVNRSAIITYGARVPEFADSEREAIAAYRDSLAAELTRRARDGIRELRFNRSGDLQGSAIRYSDGLLAKALERADRIVGDMPTPADGGRQLDANLVAKLSPEGRRALRIVLSELAGLVPTEEDMQLEGISSAIDAQAVRTC